MAKASACLILAPYDADIDRAGEWLRLALGEIGRHRLPANPLNLWLWYEYFAGRNRQLKETMDAIIGSGNPFDQECCLALFTEFFTHHDEGLEAIRMELMRLVDGLRNNVDKSGERWPEYLTTLENFVDRIKAIPNQKPLQDVIDQVIRETEETGESQRQFGSQLALVVEEADTLRVELEKARRETVTDSLTGVGNRKAMELAITDAMDEFATTGRGLSLLVADIDYFKGFNDKFGHLVGDRVIKYVAEKIRDCIKGADTVARFGGEEFAVVLPSTPRHGAFAVAEQIRESIAALPLKNARTGVSLGRVTVSIGVAEFRHEESAEKFIERADRALYRAKQNGRNRVEYAD